VFTGLSLFGPWQILSSWKALLENGIEPLLLQPKEHLGILNGTTFSAFIAALALHDPIHLALLTHVCTAMGTETLHGSRGSSTPRSGKTTCSDYIQSDLDIYIYRSSPHTASGNSWKAVNLLEPTK